MLFTTGEAPLEVPPRLRPLRKYETPDALINSGTSCPKPITLRKILGYKVSRLKSWLDEDVE